MKAKQLLFSLVVLLSLNYFSLSAQNLFPLTAGSNVEIDGGYIKLFRPATSGTWARGLFFYNTKTDNEWGGIGLYGASETVNSIYIGHGNDPWWGNKGIYILANGNTGIGTNTPSDGKLHIYKNETIGGWSGVDVSNAGLRIQDSGANMYIDGNTIYSDQNMAFGSIGNKYITFGTNNTERLRIDETGNVGIGTTSPSAKLEIKNSDTKFIKFERDGVSKKAHIGYGTANEGGMYLGTDDNQYTLWVQQNGNVGIGTTAPDHKLDVAGTIHTQEVKVDMTGWSDFVFHPTYNLRPLQEVNTYIQQNGHLPEIPTAKEVEENGISLGKMNIKLLQKIEELTLYTIEQERKIENYDKRLKEQDDRIGKLEEIIKKLQ